MPHTCHAEGCEVAVPPKLLMCLKHWRMVPKHLQREVWMRAAIDAVAQRERG
jgi:hypothetical protein